MENAQGKLKINMPLIPLTPVTSIENFATVLALAGGVGIIGRRKHS
ncbi:hypothetical protein [Arcanobacterium buesumense]|uniref:Uncharacterized protein n=1 Tax=Arcanobacterium buesumense TaxID=2722751 RepID=A0A6H2EJE0_9ACTO|nr:hypothetical protein [Arcanobacterium buesumense]QJC21083.1 hypothetical protein HC352_00155 [Arcanobacterium buesumense]